MELSAKRMRAQLNFLKPVSANFTLETTRKGQDQLGRLMALIHRRDVLIQAHQFQQFAGAWILPKDERREGVILYLHGGGYTCGNLDYAKGFGATLADSCGVRVFCAAYRLAPEHPFPAALDDALEAYRFLRQKGYRRIALCGESAGGGLCYALCLKLRELELPMPDSIIGISPWTDLTNSGATFASNREVDPTLSKELLDFYADCYTADRENPLVSPLFGELDGMPPSLLFAGGDEILLDDARRLHDALRKAGCKSKLIVAPERWHAYVLFHLRENRSDFDAINSHLDKTLSLQHKLRWLRLDNAAKIYPAAARRKWNNFFRVSATLQENVDVQVLQSALDVTVRRFPSIGVRLRRGLFWYYLEQISNAPEIEREDAYPLVHVPFRKLKTCAFRVIAHENRIAVELFHALTDGTGALIFLKSLVAEYLEQKYNISISPTDGVLSRLESPREEELEDSFLQYSGAVAASRKESTAYHLSGTPEPDGFLHLTSMELPAQAMIDKAHGYGISVTEFLCAVMTMAIIRLQAEKVPNRRRRKPVKVLMPVNLRKLLPSQTLRNFALYVTPEIDTRLGDYSFEQLCAVIHHKMRLETDPHLMQAKIATNVNDERNFLLQITPLFVKNLVMRAVFDTVGERKSCLSLSNLGVVTLPQAMQPYVQRMDFIIGPQAKAPHNCGVLTYNGTVYVNFIRNIQQADLEMHFYKELQRQGIPVKVASNQR